MRERSSVRLAIVDIVLTRGRCLTPILHTTDGSRRPVVTTGPSPHEKYYMGTDYLNSTGVHLLVTDTLQPLAILFALSSIITVEVIFFKSIASRAIIAEVFRSKGFSSAVILVINTAERFLVEGRGGRFLHHTII